MEILSGYDLTVKKKKSKDGPGAWMALMLPIQFVEDSEKTVEWSSMTMNFIERMGMIQLERNLNWLSKNYLIANNLIDKRDYIPDEHNENTALLNKLTDTDNYKELKSVPFIQLVVNTLTNEFAKRPSKISFSLLDNASMDEMFADKEEKIGKILEMKAAIQQQQKMQEMGLDPNSDQGKQMMAPETLKSLPEVQEYYNHSYRSLYQEWAELQMAADTDKFYLNELYKNGFKDSLIASRVFTEFQMREDDYNIRRLHPIQTFYRKSPDERWIQNGQWAGHLSLMTLPDVLDMFGWMMSEEQMDSLQKIYPATAAGWATDGLRPEGMWDPSKSYEYNRTGPGIAMRQMMSATGVNPAGTGDIVNRLFSDSEDMIDTQFNQLIRVSTIYWKTQRHLFELTKIDENGQFTRSLVTGDYVVTDKPIYNTLVYKQKTKENLVFGEHLDGIWTNEVWGGIKIGPNLPIYGWSGEGNNFSPMYLGTRGGKPGKMPYQFKAPDDKWGSMLPICGSVFNDEHVHSRSLVDSLKIYQIAVNMTANQILDLMVDELGVIVTFNPLSLPRHSMGEDWGPDPFPKAYAFMRDFNMLPIQDGVTEQGNVNPNSFQKLDLSQSQRFITKIKLHQFFKEEGLAAVGMNPGRVGKPIEQETATGVEQTVAASYSATEHLFTQFDDYMVRFHQMRTDLAQYYNSNNPSVRLQYTTSSGMRMWFEIDGTKLKSREFGLRTISTPHTRHVLEEIKKMVLKNNTTDTSLTDLIRIEKSETMSDIENIIKDIDQKHAKQAQAKQQQDQQLQQQEEQHQLQLQREKIQNENQQKELDRQNALEVAQIQISPKIADAGKIEDNTNELSQNMVQHNQKMDMEREKNINHDALEKQKITLGQQKIQAEDRRTHQELKNKQTELHIKNKTAQQKKK